jgi:hypothetical protein
MSVKLVVLVADPARGLNFDRAGGGAHGDGGAQSQEAAARPSPARAWGLMDSLLVAAWPRAVAAPVRTSSS